MSKKMFQMLLVSLVMSNFALGQELTWQREYDARVNGQLMINAYSGGDAMTWPKSAFVDIDNDGDLDLFVGTRKGIIKFYRNDGNKTNPIWILENEFYNSIDVGSNANPTFCDIDADDDFDLFIGSGMAGCSGGNVAFYRNIGTPNSPDWFCAADSLASIDVCDQSAPTFVDIDADGDFDLFVGAGYGEIAFCRNIGTPQAAVWDSVNSYYNQIDVFWRSTPTFADIDADGDFDMFVGNDVGQLRFYQNNGDSTLPVWNLVTTEYANVNFHHPAHTSLVFADIDGDKDLDLFVNERYGNMNFYRNQGTQQNPDWLWETADYISGTIDIGGNSTPTFCDIDDDGDFDMFIGKENGNIRFYRNIGDSIEPHWNVESEAYNAIYVRTPFSGASAAPIFVDIDEDNDLDMFVGTGKGNIKFYCNQSNSVNPEWCLVSELYEPIDVWDCVTPVFADIDADNDLDLFVGNLNGTIYQYLNVGTPDSAIWSFVTAAYDSIDVGSYSTPTFADLDKDGDFDLVIGNNTGKIYLYQNDGDSSLADFTFVTDAYNSIDVGSYSTPTFVDIDADRDLDLFVGSKDGGINFWRNITGESTYVEHSTAVTPQIFILHPNYPNPFNPTTAIKYSLPKSCWVKLEVFNTLGQKVATLVDGIRESGSYQVTWNGADSPTGIYFYCLETKGFSKTMKMLLMK